jgi:hypothetical protein
MLRMREAARQFPFMLGDIRPRHIRAPCYHHPLFSRICTLMARLSGIDLNLLLVFDAVYRHGSATAAANELNLTQPAVSNALTRLRGALNDPLFVRGPRGFLPTPYADSVAGAISEILARLDQTFSQVPTFDPTRAARAFHLTANLSTKPSKRSASLDLDQPSAAAARNPRRFKWRRT